MDSDERGTNNDERDNDTGGESWLAEQARLILLEDGS